MEKIIFREEDQIGTIAYFSLLGLRILSTGTGEEYIDMERNRGTYLPVWLDINKLASVDVRTKEVALIVQSLFSTAK